MKKRFFDFFGALGLLVLTSPLFLGIALAVKATSPGPIVFRQRRAGYRGVPFTVLKFRTLTDESDRPFDMVLQGDSRITAVGRFLRKTHMDELPQLINVLFGEMSLVGPRPRPLDVCEKNSTQIVGYKRRFEVRPGLTGLEQLRGRMWSLKHGPRRSLRLELYYIRHQSLWYDLKILIKTVETVRKCKGI
jgi:lipopolysaccharide/colanic/teichoic acid biosynthesis glycosyltransferase